MKTQNSIIATITVITVMIMALMTSFTASANVYEDRLQTAFGDIINAVSLSSREHMLSIYSDPETGNKEGQLDVYKFTIDRNGIDLINDAKRVYEQISDDLDNSKKELYVLWWNDNDRDFQGYRLYYNPEDAIVVGLACDHCYTVGFVPSDDKQHRKTYTIEWNDASAGDSIMGRLVTTYAPIKAKSTSDGFRILGVNGRSGSVVIDTDDFDKWIDQIQAVGMEKYQKGMEKAQAKLEKAQDKLEKAQSKLEKSLSKSQSKSSSFSSSFSSSSSNSSSSQTVNGQVTDPNGEPLIGAQVQTIEGGNTVYTDMNGRFMLIIPNHVKTLKVSYVGYVTQELPVQPNMIITMTQYNALEHPGNDNLSDLFLRKKDSNPSDKDYSSTWMKKLLFYVEKIQQPGDRYLYLSKLYELCKDTEGLDQTDLKIAMQQLASVYKQLKEKKKLKENELIFLESMVDLLENKVNSVHYWNPD